MESFIAISWACCIADARPWLGRAVQGGHPLYIAGEGGGAIGPRITAWKRRYGVAVLPRLHVLTVPVNLLQPAQVQLLIASIRQVIGEALNLIVIDTLSRSMAGGNESSGEDGSAALDSADLLRQTFGCAVLLVAHVGYNDSHIRGWSGYFQWAETVIKADASDRRPRLDLGDLVTLTCEKVKNSEPFAPTKLTAAAERWTVTPPVGTSGDEVAAGASVQTRSSLVIVAADDGVGGGSTAARPREAHVTLPRSHELVLYAVSGHHSSIRRAELVVYAAPYGLKRSAVYCAVQALV